MPGHCPVCRNPTLGGWRNRCTLGECLGRTATEWALHDAREAYAADKITSAELEQRIEMALTDPPKRRYPSIVLC